MDRIQDPTATEDNQFQEAGTGTVATRLRALWLNGIQEELIHILEEAGITPSSATLTQVLQALKVIFPTKAQLSASDGSDYIGYGSGTLTEALVGIAGDISTLEGEVSSGLTGGAPVYADTTAGLAATSEGEYFNVPSAVDGELLILYLHDTGDVATEIGRSISAGAVDGIPESSVDVVFASVSAGLNLFSPSAITSGQTLRNGGLVAQGTTFVTGYIPVVAGGDFISSGAIKGDDTYGGVSFYDYAYNVLSYSHAAVTAETAVSVPSGAVWMRCAFDVATISASALGIYSGDTLPSLYRAYGVVDPQSQRDGVNSQSPELHGLINAFDPAAITDEYYLTSSNNTEVANSTYYITSYIPVVQGGTVTFSASTSLGSGFGLTWYDAEQNHIAGAAGQGTPPVADTPYTVPTRASYVRATFHRVNQPASDLVVVQSASVPDDYLPHGIGQALDYLSPWAGAGVMHLGDSITDNFRGDTQWVEYLRGKMRSVLVANEAKAGRRMRDCAKTTAGDDLVVGDLTDVDLIICMCGTNDFNAARVGGTGALLGTIDDAASYAANSFYANTKYVIETLLGLKSTVRIVFFTPTYRSAAPSADTESAEGYTLYDYADAVKQVCALYGVPVLDLLRDGGLNSFNTGDYLADGLHPTSTDGGVTIIGKPAAAWLSSIR